MIKVETKMIKDLGTKCKMQTTLKFEGDSRDIIEELKMILNSAELQPLVIQALTELGF